MLERKSNWKKKPLLQFPVENMISTSLLGMKKLRSQENYQKISYFPELKVNTLKNYYEEHDGGEQKLLRLAIIITCDSVKWKDTLWLV